MVDAAVLHETFARTLVPSGDASRQAEQQLIDLEMQPQFVIGLLQIIVEPGADMGVRRASAIYLKNKINRSWAPTNVDVLSDADKQLFKQQLVPAIVASPPVLRSFLIVCLATVLNVDFQKNLWPEFLDELKQLIQSTDDLAKIAAGLSILKQLCKFYRWNLNSVSKQLGPLMAEFYPKLLQIAESAAEAVRPEAAVASNAVASNAVASNEAYYELIYNVLKIYKLSTARFLPEIFRQEDIAKRTITLFLHVFVLPLPPAVLQVQPAAERTQLVPLKCQKWAVVNITKTYNSYLTQSYMQLSENSSAYEPFRELFNAMFAPEITRIFLEQLLKWSRGDVWLSDAVLYNIITFLESMIMCPSVFGPLLEPQITGLLQSVLFTLMCPSDDDMDLFVDDSVEFMQRRLDLNDINHTPSIAASNFIERLVKKKKQCVAMIVEFLQSCSSGLQNSPDEVKARVGMFKFVKTVQFLFHKKDGVLYNQLEPFLIQFVIPDLQSKHAYLRFEACDTIEQTANTVFASRDALQQLFQSIVFCFFDQEHLPVQVAAALALQSLSAQPHNEDIRAALGEHITEIIRQLLLVTQRVDCEPLLMVLDHFVDQFPDKIGPFAVGLAAQLSQQFVVLAADLVEQTQALEGDSLEAESQFLKDNDEKISTGLGIMNSLANLQSQLENKRELTESLDETMSPIFQTVYQSDFLDFYNDCFNLHENSLFTLKAVPDRHWLYFDTLIAFVQRTTYDYFEEVMPVFESYIAFGSQHLAQNPARLQSFIALLLSLYAPQPSSVSDDSSGVAASFSDARTRAHVMSLAARLFASHDLFNGPLIPFLKQVIEGVLQRVAADASSKSTFPPRYNVSTVSLILACIYYDPRESIRAMMPNNALMPFLETWFQTIGEFARVNDLKLCVVTALSLLNYFANQPEVQPVYVAEIVKALTHALERLPGAVARVNEILAEEKDNLWDEDDDDYGLGSEEDDEEDNDNGSGADGSDAFEQALAPDAVSGESVFMHEQPGNSSSRSEEATAEEKAAIQSAIVKEMDFISEDFDSDIYSVSPLDGLNPYEALRSVLGNMQAQAPTFYGQIMGSAAENDKAVLMDSLQMKELPKIDRS